jgi:hypothetical protein
VEDDTEEVEDDTEEDEDDDFIVDLNGEWSNQVLDW